MLDLIGTTEVCEVLGVSRRSVFRYMKRRDFPKPVGKVSGRRVWRRREVERWGKRTLPLPKGRPVED